MANETEIVEVRLPILPKGYRYTGEYRYAVKGDYVNPRGNIIEWISRHDTDNKYHVIEKIEWVPRKGEVFYIVTDTCTVREVYYLEDVVDEMEKLIEVGNYFKTQRLARSAADAMKAMFKELPHE